jgi:phosphoribosylaminoimidazole-succinocarboxamide synthase
MTSVILKTEVAGVELFRRGKVRDVYAVEDKLLIVATDRISAFDVVLPSAIPHKGAVLTALSIFWFDFLKDTVQNHFITADIGQYPPPLRDYGDQLSGRSMLVKRVDVVPIECVARGYLVGSGWKEYKKTGEVCGIKLPAGLRESDQLPEPIFTPSTKAEEGHDVNISEQQMADIVGKELTERLGRMTLDIYEKASRYARERGIIIADTKFEFGMKDGEIILADEVLTPDSSRFWPRESYEPGRAQQSFDKQYVRDYLETLEWGKTPPGPILPDPVIQQTSEKYLQAYKLITGTELTIDGAARSKTPER